MMSAISNTAEFGAHAAGPVLIDDDVRARMRTLLERVRDGSFAATLAGDHRRGFPWFGGRRRQLAEHAIERAGREVRSWMPWLTGARPEPTEDRYPPRAGVARS